MKGLKRVAGLWLPLWEQRLVPLLESGSAEARARRRLSRILSLRRSTRRAIEVGGHVGLWSRQLARWFESVVSFEPIECHRTCFGLNVLSPRVALFPFALGAERKTVAMTTGVDSTAESRVAGAGSLPMHRLDEIGMSARPVDLLSLDCEGYEYFVLRGAERLLRTHKPLIVIERKPKGAARYGVRGRDTLDYLTGLGASLREEIETDVILDWGGDEGR